MNAVASSGASACWQPRRPDLRSVRRGARRFGLQRGDPDVALKPSRSQDPRAVIGDGNGVFPVRRPGTVVVVTTVHLVVEDAGRVVPSVNIGSMASTEPATSSGPLPGSPSLGRNGSMCICRPIRGHPASTMPYRRSCASLSGPRPHLDGARRRSAGFPGSSPRYRPPSTAGWPDSASSAGMSAPTPKVTAASPCQPSMMAPQSIDTRSPWRSTSAADGYQKPHDRSPRSRCWRIAVVTQEGRHAAGLTDDRLGDVVEILGGRSRRRLAERAQCGDDGPAAAIASSSPGVRAGNGLAIAQAGQGESATHLYGTHQCERPRDCSAR